MRDNITRIVAEINSLSRQDKIQFYRALNRDRVKKNLGDLSEETKDAALAILDRSDKVLFEIVPTLPENTAKHLSSRYNLSTRWLESEGKELHKKARKSLDGKTRIVDASSLTDMTYEQLKPAGSMVRVEIKSRSKKIGGIQAGIMEAEQQHKARLKDEDESESTWHKTVIDKVKRNPWPFNKAKLESEDITPDDVLKKAENKINELIQGSVDAPTNLKDENWSGENNKKSFNRLKDISDYYDSNERKLTKAAKKKVKNIVQDDDNKDGEILKLRRRLLVTERVTVTNVYKDKKNKKSQYSSVVLDRAEEGHFVAHWKGQSILVQDIRNHHKDKGRANFFGKKSRSAIRKRLKDLKDPKDINDKPITTPRFRWSAIGEQGARARDNKKTNFTLSKKALEKKSFSPRKIDKYVRSPVIFGYPHHMVDKNNNRALHLSAMGEDKKMLAYLLSKNSRYTANNDKKTPLHYTAQYGPDSNEIVSTLLGKKMSKN